MTNKEGTLQPMVALGAKTQCSVGLSVNIVIGYQQENSRKHINEIIYSRMFRYAMETTMNSSVMNADVSIDNIVNRINKGIGNILVDMGLIKMVSVRNMGNQYRTITHSI